MKIKILGAESLRVKGLSCFEKLKMLLETKPKGLYEFDKFQVLIIVMKIVINKEEKLWIGVAVESNNGLEAEISGHFGRCPYYAILEVQEGKVKEPVKVIANPYFSSHGEPGQVPSFLKEQGIEVIIAGGMGPRAVQFFSQLAIKVVTGVSGKVKEAVDSFLKGELKSSESCHY